MCILCGAVGGSCITLHLSGSLSLSLYIYVCVCAMGSGLHSSLFLSLSVSDFVSLSFSPSSQGYISRLSNCSGSLVSSFCMSI